MKRYMGITDVMPHLGGHFQDAPGVALAKSFSRDLRCMVCKCQGTIPCSERRSVKNADRTSASMPFSCKKARRGESTSNRAIRQTSAAALVRRNNCDRFFAPLLERVFLFRQRQSCLPLRPLFSRSVNRTRASKFPRGRSAKGIVPYSSRSI